MKGTFALFLSCCALFSAAFNIINDCDETYNYWEPLHYLKQQSGFMTWEYDPRYAIRSWTFILFYYIITYPFGNSFMAIRTVLAIMYSASMAVFIQSNIGVFGKQLSLPLLLLIGLSPGLFVSSTAFLPSSFSMYCVAMSYGLLCQGKRSLSLLCVIVMTVFGWPFSGVFVVMQIVDLLYNFNLNYLKMYLASGILYSIISVLISVAIDSYFYKKTVFVAWNIVKYNVFGSNGPELYGIEPISYYLKVMILHWGPLALLIPFSFLLSIISRHRMRVISTTTSILWLAIFCLQPHKEERFLYPIYPLIAVELSHMILYLKSIYRFLFSLSIASFMVFSYLRISALTQRRTVIDLFKMAPQNATICIGDEWHLFPTSVLLTSQKIAFIKDTFDGILPYTFEKNVLDNKIPLHLQTTWIAASLEITNVNDQNKQEMNRYVDITLCDYQFTSSSIDTGHCIQKLSSNEPFFGRVLKLPFTSLKVKEYYCFNKL